MLESINEVEERIKFSVGDEVEEKGSGGSRWRQRFVDGDQKHSRRMLESINEVEERIKFSVGDEVEEKGSGGSRWRQRFMDGDKKHSRRMLVSMGMRGLCLCPG